MTISCNTLSKISDYLDVASKATRKASELQGENRKKAMNIAAKALHNVTKLIESEKALIEYQTSPEYEQMMRDIGIKH